MDPDDAGASRNLMAYMLIGAGGNAKAVASLLPEPVQSYVAPEAVTWLVGTHFTDDESALEAEPKLDMVMGVGGVTPKQLSARLALAYRYTSAGFAAPPVIAKSASVMERVGIGVVAMERVVIQAGCQTGEFVLLNAGAVVTHDCRIGNGTHIGPGAVICGGVTIGECCMIGAGAVVLPQAEVPAGTLVKAGTRFPR